MRSVEWNWSISLEDFGEKSIRQFISLILAYPSFWHLKLIGRLVFVSKGARRRNVVPAPQQLGLSSRLFVGPFASDQNLFGIILEGRNIPCASFISHALWKDKHYNFPNAMCSLQKPSQMTTECSVICLLHAFIFSESNQLVILSP